MLVISFMTKKGGAGKSTLAFSTAVAAKQAGESVALLDLDSQGSTSFWAEARKRTDIYVESLSAWHLTKRIEELAASGFTLCVLDTPGSDDDAELAIAASDLCLIPARPNVFDLRAGEATRRLIVGEGKTGVFLLNQCPPAQQSARVQEGAKALEEAGVLIAPMISARVDFQDAARAGLGVTEIAPSGHAAQEIRELWTSILQIARPEQWAPSAPGDETPATVEFSEAA